MHGSINRQHVADDNCAVLSVFHTDLQKINPVSIQQTAHLLGCVLCTNVVDDSKWTIKRKGQKGRWGGREGGREKVRGCVENKQHKKTSPTTAGPLSFHCVPHQMPIHGASGCREAGERRPPSQSRGLCCVAHREERGGLEWGREGGMDGWEEGNYEFSAWKVQVLLKVSRSKHQLCCCVSATPLLYD